tara:strand:+ start:520 stop:693 length:174 start_codon:yes stop_codon:yes gene_type:complete
MAYGGEVLDELVARGVEWDAAYHAGMVCLSVLLQEHVGEPEVADAENFTEAEAGSTS